MYTSLYSARGQKMELNFLIFKVTPPVKLQCELMIALVVMP